ncbi:hypothetical protein [Fimbriimonas ginsengisoli]|uniref:hypothetical protein n=1 Tax=Fimbriimonas ginsengisoli TaxID=1005039 RepID=UPI00046CFA48|nr:hypothetical protein [Fimbriimonas ginsengisoli]
MAVLPWCLKGGTESAVKTARETITTLFEKTKHEVLSPAAVQVAWETDLKLAPIPTELKDDEDFPAMPSAKDLLALGKKLHVDWVCAGRAKWHTKSVWVSLGPKTKADCTVDCMIIDVKKEEVALDAKNVKADSTRVEKGLETAGALLVSMGFTALSGGPKTPHQQRAARQAIGLAFEPWLKTTQAASKKIGD